MYGDVRSGTEQYGISPLSVILRYSPLISVQNFAPLPVRSLADGRRPASPMLPIRSIRQVRQVRQVRRVRQKNSAQSYCAGTRARRKPRKLQRSPGELLSRPAERQRLALSNQLPPRNTRSEPVFGPVGSVTAFSL